MPKLRTAAVASRCNFCGNKIAVGGSIALDLELRRWLHKACWYRRNQPSEWEVRPAD